MIWSHYAFVVTVVSLSRFSPSDCRPFNEVEKEPPTTTSAAKEIDEYAATTESNASQTSSVILDDEEEQKLKEASSTVFIINSDQAGGDGKIVEDDSDDVKTLFLTAIIAAEIPTYQDQLENAESVATEDATNSKSLTLEASNDDALKKKYTEDSEHKLKPLIFIVDGVTNKLESADIAKIILNDKTKDAIVTKVQTLAKTAVKSEHFDEQNKDTTENKNQEELTCEE